MGLLGAILISRLIQQITALKEQKERLFAEYREVLDDTHRELVIPIRGANQDLSHFIPRVENGLSGTESTYAPLQRIDRPFGLASLSYGQARGSMEITDEALVMLKEDQALSIALLSGFHAFSTSVSLESLRSQISALNKLRTDYATSIDSISNVLHSRLLHAETRLSVVAAGCDRYRASIVPRTLWLLLAVLVFLGIFCVLAPLAVLANGQSQLLVDPPDPVMRLYLVFFLIGGTGLVYCIRALIREVEQESDLTIPLDLHIYLANRIEP